MTQERGTAESEVDGWVELRADEAGASGPLSARRARDWGLVLSAHHIPHRMESAAQGRRLWVPPAVQERALAEVARFEAENRDWPPPPGPARSLVDNTLITVSVLIALAIFYNLTVLPRLFGHSFDWLNCGDTAAGRILAGQWWRTVTALTLHADALHLLGNVVLGGFFFVRLCRELGSGLGWSLAVLCGALGNFANAWLQPADHRSIGASTAIFGVVGLLAMLSLLRDRRRLLQRWPLPLAAAAGLLALLGTGGHNTDLGAHLCGFAVGLLLGLPAGWLLARRGRPGRLVNALLAFTALVAVAGSWALALGGGC